MVCKIRGCELILSVNLMRVNLIAFFLKGLLRQVDNVISILIDNVVGVTGRYDADHGHHGIEADVRCYTNNQSIVLPILSRQDTMPCGTGCMRRTA